MRIIGHRGAPVDAPENTLDSFQKAIEAGADGIELDIHRTLDNQLVVVHNAEFSVAGQETQYIADHSYTKLLRWLPDLPFLESVLELCKKSGKRIEIEIKRQDRQTIELCLALIDRYDFRSMTEVISFHPTVLAAVKQEDPRVLTGLLFAPFPDWMQDKHQVVTVLDGMGFIEANVAHININYVNQSLVQAVQGEGYIFHASGVDAVPQVGQAIELGVDQITTNDPRLAVKCLLEWPVSV